MKLIAKQVDVEVTPEDAAIIFCSSDGEEQARFFNEVARLASSWKNPFCFQMQTCSDNSVLTQEGRYIMRIIGEYSENQNKG